MEAVPQFDKPWQENISTFFCAFELWLQRQISCDLLYGSNYQQELKSTTKLELSQTNNWKSHSGSEINSHTDTKADGAICASNIWSETKA